jgi:hypothetical protein
MSVKIKYEDALSMYLALKSKKAPTWDAKQMAARLQQLPGVIDSESEEVKALEGTDAKIFDTVCEAVEAKKKIIVTEPAKANTAAVDEAPAEKPAKSSGKKPTKKSAPAKSSDKKPAKKSTKKPAASGNGKPTKKKKGASADRGTRGHTTKDKAFSKFLAKPSIGAAALERILEGKATIATCRSWLSGWAAGKGLPTSATDKMDRVKEAIKARKDARKEMLAAK